MILLNFKAYRESAGERGLELVRAAARVARREGYEVAVAPQVQDLALVAKSFRLPVYAQHVDAVSDGAATGSVCLFGLRSSGCVGSLINHSEKKVRLIDVEQVIAQAKELGLKIVACANNVNEARALASLAPHAVAIEPPELIGSGVAVSRARPEVITQALRAVKGVAPSVLLLCGAGISNAGDVARAIELGADGVLVASAFVKAKDPYAFLRDAVRAARAAHAARAALAARRRERR